MKKNKMLKKIWKIYQQSSEFKSLPDKEQKSDYKSIEDVTMKMI